MSEMAGVYCMDIAKKRRDHQAKMDGKEEVT